MRNYLVFQAYGHVDILHEAIYAIASWYKHGKADAAVIIYTDNAEYLQQYLPQHIIYEPLNEAKIKAWRGELNFVHRLKIELLKHCAEKYAGNILYLDTDTYFIQSAAGIFESIEAGNLWMHLPEGQLNSHQNLILKKIDNFIRKNDFSGTKIPRKTMMWNAGLLGFSSEKKQLLTDVLALTDCMYKRYQKHVIEQLAFSYIFQINGKIQRGDEVVFHYWNFKEFRLILSEVFSQTTDFQEITSKIDHIKPAILMQAKMAFEQLPSWRKKWRKWTGNTWKMSKINW